MEVFIGKPKTGKTTLLIQRCHEANKMGELSYIVCASHQEAYRIKQKANEMGLDIPFPISYTEFIDRAYSMRHIKNFFIDNLDIFVQRMTPVKIAMVTINK